MLDITNIAIGQTDAEGVETKGWWVIAPNRCADIIEGDLTNQFIYIYAIDVKGQTILEGHNQFCVGLKKFYISGIKDCHIRGYSTGLFHEIDTGKAHDWTLFLKDSN